MVIVVPFAETSEQHAAAYGMPFNAQDFINQAKEHYSEFKKDGEEWKQRAKEKTARMATILAAVYAEPAFLVGATVRAATSFGWSDASRYSAS